MSSGNRIAVAGCYICNVPATKCCSKCSIAKYCSREHQLQDWKEHKKNCQIFEVKVLPIVGRSLVAKRNIEAGEVIIDELPLFTGESSSASSSSPLFVFIYTCVLMMNIPYVPGGKYVARCICILRCLWLKRNEPEKWKHVVSMESHAETRRHLQPEFWRMNQNNIVQFIRYYLKFHDMTDVDEAEIHDLCGIWNTNAFDVRNAGIENLRGLFQPLSHTLARRSHLEFSKIFFCHCQRCEDPTEFGTFMTAWKCQACDDGRLIISDANDPNSDWVCYDCKNKVESSTVKDIEQKVKTHFAQLGKTAQEMEAFLEKFSRIMLPTTSYAIQIKYALMELLPSDENDQIEIQKKEDICKELLNLMNVLCPGLTRVRAMICVQLGRCQRQFATLLGSNEKNAQVAAQSKLLSSREFLEEALNILIKEPEGTHFYDLGKQIQAELVEINDTLAHHIILENCTTTGGV
ncbi:unnamed protein product [Notodromas monacha]|uniref:MYND-type domain-containing protein n=1 Tax=Notodromas monacha TaxID=399045 RepID=A0A7R9GJX0_9CRUS|nr:unnamed protein product [Notodromas monacha]CAG0924115.1 unnamed protein product [Notodromas monacha]